MTTPGVPHSRTPPPSTLGRCADPAPSSLSRARIARIRSRGAQAGVGAPGRRASRGSPPARWAGVHGSRFLSPLLRVVCFPKEVARAGAPSPRVARRGTRLRLAPIHPAKVKREEEGRPRLARNVHRSQTQTMISRASLPSPPPPAGLSLPGPHCCPTRRCRASGDGPRSLSPPPEPAPPTPFQVSGRVSRGDSAGARPPPGAPPLGREWGGGGGRARSALYLSPNSCPKAAWHARTQKRGLSGGSARVLALRVAIGG